jgi:hypothetical protein
MDYDFDLLSEFADLIGYEGEVEDYYETLYNLDQLALAQEEELYFESI